MRQNQPTKDLQIADSQVGWLASMPSVPAGWARVWDFVWGLEVPIILSRSRFADLLVQCTRSARTTGARG
jgi:hypothetical protein